MAAGPGGTEGSESDVASDSQCGGQLLCQIRAYTPFEHYTTHTEKELEESALGQFTAHEKVVVSGYEFKIVSGMVYVTRGASL